MVVVVVGGFVGGVKVWGGKDVMRVVVGCRRRMLNMCIRRRGMVYSRLTCRGNRSTRMRKELYRRIRLTRWVLMEIVYRV